MGSSAKKKREKKKDFQKQKLKVGKARPKADNHTDTSFRSKAIVLNQQLDVNAPTQASVFLHQVSLLNSRADTQRRDALAYLTTYVAATPGGKSLPITMNNFLTSLCPLMLDGSAAVRTQLLKLFQTLPKEDVKDNVAKILPYIRAGMTHLSKDIRVSSIEFLSCLIELAGSELVSCPGGWYQTLQCFTSILDWKSSDPTKWSSGKAGFSADAKSTARIMQVLALFLQQGLSGDGISSSAPNPVATDFPLWHTGWIMIPQKSNPYAYLNLFGVQQDDEKQTLDDREDRLRVYNSHFQPLIVAGIETAKKEGGELGRASGLLVKTLERAVNK
ncbi:rRNA processing protein [Knufia peltigerae]|uniref:Pre-rRNA-processing protein n=1 Tax=Knufia peltigerae TaxID=1002370 RepID=A0AA38YFP0_9EURO|nr:rRNA processing protein [Knufia peltigerae]